MDNINDLVNQAMEEWDNETNCGETDPAFGGEVGEEIDKLVDGLKSNEVDKLLADKNPIVFVEEIPYRPGIMVTKINLSTRPIEGFILTCAKCGRQVNITQENQGDYVSSFIWGVTREHFKEFTDSTLGIYDIEDDCGPIITCPCGNNSWGIPAPTSTKPEGE